MFFLRQKNKEDIEKRPFFKNLARVVCICLLFGCLLGIPSFAYSSAGSKADPIVSKSWVDKYVKNEFASLETQLAAIKSSLNSISGKNNHIVLHIGSTTAAINGETVAMDVAPRLVGSYTMLPIRFIGEALDMTVHWDSAKKTVTCTKSGKTIILPQNSRTATVNGQTVSLPASPVEINNRILVPVRFISENFGCTVVWDGTARSVTIY